MSLRSLTAAIYFTLAAAVFAGPALARADAQHDDALAVTEKLLNGAHDVLASGGGGPALRNVISGAFAFDIWERYLIDQRKDAFNTDQRREFKSLLPGFMAFLYHKQFDKGLNQAPALGDARKVRRDVMVGSTFQRVGGGNLPVDWRLRHFPDRGARVIDIMVAGTSFLVLKREEFTAIIDNGGADAVLTHMRQNSY